ncbi:PQQ-like beta-propeller repeat protein [Actinomadura sp. HBU206391]|nr:PQQ-binding-like beta-propeller repeat protein [Actinomadura sp. HBU206391]MBC6457336.1 PQQ-like beta-propeller repeat protein [Actinomadura sp. HBU206391]
MASSTSRARWATSSPGSKGGYLTALDAATGAVRWRRRTKEAIGSDFAVADGVIYLPDDALYALDTATGRVRWTYKLRTPKNIALANGLVYCGNFQGEELHVVTAATGKRRWTYRTGGPITARPLVANGAVHVGDWKGGMFALDAVTGSMRWQLRTGGSIESSATMAGGLVCFGSGAFSDGTCTPSIRPPGDPCGGTRPRRASRRVRPRRRTGPSTSRARTA